MILKTIIPAAIIGTVLSIAVGYSVASLSRSGAISFAIWSGIEYYKYTSKVGDVLAWAIGGALVGAAVGFLWSQNSN